MSRQTQESAARFIATGKDAGDRELVARWNGRRILNQRDVMGRGGWLRGWLPAAFSTTESFRAEGAQMVEPEQLTIDAEFEGICRPHSDEEKREFRKSIERDGYRDAIVCWQDGTAHLILDGHNRFRHWCAYDETDPERRPAVIVLDLPDRAAAITWIVRNQLSRRNLSPVERIELAKRLEPAIKEQAKANQSHGETAPGKTLDSKLNEAIKTTEEVAKAAGVSVGTLHSYDTVMESGEDDIKAAVKSGEKSIGGAAKEIKQRQAAMQQPAPVQIPWTPQEIELRRRMEAGKTVAVDADVCPHLAQWCRDRSQAVSLSTKKLKGKAIVYTDLPGNVMSDLAEAVNE